MKRRTSITLYPKVEKLLSKVPPWKRSRIINLAIYKLLNGADVDVDTLLQEAEKLLKCTP